ncbi:3-phosphoshikimate 1-carboxyvinyltransferase [Candidatus Peregrinibacteria bacterium]|nr:3-phosphoshikimate 1-carboxyvinyltransferase [Candidatus Peregrinibacteria bacterium]
MSISIKPTRLKKFFIRVPSSKSYTNRALILAALAKGTSILKNVLISDDTLVTIHALKNLGIKITKHGNNLIIKGKKGHFTSAKKALSLENAGTAVRFLTSVLTLTHFKSVITGNKQMLKRPIGDLVDALNQLGANVQCENGCPPIIIDGCGLVGGKTIIRGDISSQFISALLIAAPYAEKKTTIQITEKITSASYIDTTIDIMDHFGVKIKKILSATFIIKPKQTYQASTYAIPADASSLSYFLAIAAIHNAEIIARDITFSAQGDFQFLNILKKMGCTYEYKKNTLMFRGPKKLKNLGKIDLNIMPDAAMTTAIVCAFAKGESHLQGLKNLRYKETDRLLALFQELEKIGCHVKKTSDGLIIHGNPDNLHGATIETYKDHRMAMCFAAAATKIPGMVIKNPKCVAKTYPLFWKDLESIGVQLTLLQCLNEKI